MENKTRQIYNSVIRERKSYADISKELGVSVDTIKRVMYISIGKIKVRR